MKPTQKTSNEKHNSGFLKTLENQGKCHCRQITLKFKDPKIERNFLVKFYGKQSQYMTALIIVWALFLLLGIGYSVILFFDLTELKKTIENFNQQDYGADFITHQTQMES